MVWEPFAIAVVFGLVVSAGLYFIVMWPQVEPADDDEDAPSKSSSSPVPVPVPVPDQVAATEPAPAAEPAADPAAEPDAPAPDLTES